jgi:hypothetical protein
MKTSRTVITITINITEITSDGCTALSRKEILKVHSPVGSPSALKSFEAK